MIKITCCKDCEDREIGCHSYCEKYIREKEQMVKDKSTYYKSLPPKIYEGDFLGDDGHMNPGRLRSLKKTQKKK